MKTRLLLFLFLFGVLLPGLLSFRPSKDAPPASIPEEPTATTPAPADTLSNWELLQLAIAYTESRFNPDALGKASDRGVFQITPIYVREVNRVAGTDYLPEDAFDIHKSIELFETMQACKNPGHDRDLAIHYHNKSATYRTTVLRNYALIQRYEALREALIDYKYHQE